jgi:nitroreductase
LRRSVTRYHRLDVSAQPPSDQPLLEMMATMRAMRRLRPDPVPLELVHELIQAAMLGPSGSHLQGQVFIVVTDRDRIVRLAEIWRTVVDIYEGWIAKSDPRYGTDAPTIRAFDAIHYQRDHFHETPVVIVACYDQRAAVRRVRRRVGDFVAALRRAGSRRARRMLLGNLAAFSDRSEAASIYPAVQNLLLAARAHGLAATMTTWHLMLETDVKRVLDIPKDVRTYALIPIGWPMGRFGPVARRPTGEVIRYDHW